VGRLYLTFAINLQRQLWNLAFLHRKFALVRDQDQLRCYFSQTALKDAFNNRIREDLSQVLNLVDTVLWTVMYRDLRVWNEPEYYKTNRALWEKKRHSESSLLRLFVYEEGWLKDPLMLAPLLKGARWHREMGYKARFIEKGLAENLVSGDEPHFVSSCLINATVIRMVGYELEAAKSASKPPEQSFNRYIFDCNSQEEIVKQYKSKFMTAWDHELALEPAKFESKLRKLPEHADVVRNVNSFLARHASLN
jgi:hypothetical protein